MGEGDGSRDGAADHSSADVGDGDGDDGDGDGDGGDGDGDDGGDGDDDGERASDGGDGDGDDGDDGDGDARHHTVVRGKSMVLACQRGLNTWHPADCGLSGATGPPSCRDEHANALDRS